jgi:hypothetical protein
MNIKNFLGFYGSVVLGVVAAACSSSGSGNGGAGSGGSGGSGGLGGSGGNSGTTASGGAPVTGCDTTKCGQALSFATSVLSSTAITECCVDTTTCGLDYSAVPTTNPLNALIPRTGCSLPIQFPEAGPPPPPVHDGGLIEVPDGGKPILLDDTCSGASIPPLPALPGCCQPDGFCGSSTHQLTQLNIAPACLSNEQVKSTPFGQFAVVPPEKGCTYKVPGQPTVTGHVPDAGSSNGGKDAGSADRDASRDR